jgi:hypothetical protein
MRAKLAALALVIGALVLLAISVVVTRGADGRRR